MNLPRMLYYPVGKVGWKWAARLGLPLRVLVQVSQSSVSNRLQAICDDLPGLAVVEDTYAEFIKELHKEIRFYINEELELAFPEHQLHCDPPFQLALA